MPRRIRLMIILTSLLVFLVPASRGQDRHSIPGPPPKPDSFVFPSGGVTVPMQDFDGRPAVDIRINGKGPYRFVLGSTATVTLLDSALSRELGLRAYEGAHAAPLGGQTPQLVRIDEIRMGSAVARGVLGAAMALDVMWSGAGAPRGILSPAVFQGHLLTIDYPARRVSIQSGKLEQPDAQSVFEYTEARPTVPLRVAGRQMRVPLDTASPLGLMLPTRLLEDLPLGSPPKPGKPAATPAGEFPVSAAPVNGAIELGRYKLNVPEVRFSDARTSSVALGSIGSEVLRGFVVTLDPWNHLIRIVQAERN